jgi:uncharacterized protein with HEPN domain
MMDERLKDYLKQMRQVVADAQEFLTAMSYEEFLVDTRTQRAVVMSLLIAGEVAARVVEQFPEFARTHGEVPWHFIRGMRNRMAHGYFDLEWRIVWDTVERDAPALLGQLDSVMNEA